MVTKKTTRAKPKTISLTVEIPVHADLEQFVQKASSEAQKQARVLWRKETKKEKGKGGRPSLEMKISGTCEEIWKEWGEKFPANDHTGRCLLTAVQRRLGISPGSRSGERHVKKWIWTSVPPTDLPPRLLSNYLQDPEFMKIFANLQLFHELWKAYLQHRPPGKKLGEKLSQTTWSKINKTLQNNSQTKEALSQLQYLEQTTKDPAKLQAYKKDAKRNGYRVAKQIVESSPASTLRPHR